MHEARPEREVGKHVEQQLADLLGVQPHGFHGGGVRDLAAIHPLHGHHAGGGELGHHPRGRAGAREAAAPPLREAQVEAGGVGGLDREVHLVGDAAGQGVHDPAEPHVGEDPRRRRREEPHRPHVVRHRDLESWVLDLDRDRLPAGEGRPVHLRQRGRSPRLRLKGLEELPAVGTELLEEHNLYLRRRTGRHRVLQGLEQLPVFGRHDRHRGRKLPGLHVYAPVRLEDMHKACSTLLVELGQQLGVLVAAYEALLRKSKPLVLQS
mmetsp:Transcript_29412/g.70071  ORF Transcript_29412/g.70071 Transcript_29412/m.70071 type:complete len:265 (-) Transcript_29412:803-1597(-)